MSEEKIIKHSKNALHVLKDKEKKWTKKLAELSEEILIIVFAVSITLLLHNWNDHTHERHLERDFLAGIKTDLDSGAADLQGSVEGFQPTIDYYTNVRKELGAHQYNAAYLDSNSWLIGNTLYFVFDMGRFEAFKSSGYLRLIENQELLKKLMTLYTISIPFMIDADRTVFGNHRQYYVEHIGPKATMVQSSPDDPRIMVSKLVDDPYFRYYIMDYTAMLIERKTQKEWLIKQMKKASAAIGEELKK